MKVDNSPARGMRDLLPAEVATRDHVLSTITEIYRSYGYQRIETPALEDITRLQGGQGGENEKLIYQVLRRGLPPEVEPRSIVADLVDLGLRFDLTVPLTRFYGNNHAQLPTPFRALQVGPVWRAERPQKGRYRQFYQCDIDMIGEPGVLAEAELIEATTSALAAVGLDNVTVRLSDRRFLTAVAADSGLPEACWDKFFIALDKLDKISWDGVRAELAKSEMPGEAVAAALDKIAALQDTPTGKLLDVLADALPSVPQQSLDDFAATTASLDLLAEERSLAWQFDPTLVRGMGYYTGQIYEIAHPESSSSVAGGGRYDQLIGRSLGKDVPACGFSIGFERIVNLLGHQARHDALAILVEPDVPVAEALSAARELRHDSRTVEVVRRSGKLGAQLKRLEAASFGSFAILQLVDGAVVRSDERELETSTRTSNDRPQ
ncbi:histidine--tRNA ligase [Nocardia asteroides]|nr:histidine--tRNA ligase [Nocardia asteroides]